MQSSGLVRSGVWLQWGVVLAGLLIFVLLFFADKTNLNNPPASEKVPGEMQASETPETDSQEDLKNLTGNPELPLSLKDSISKLESLGNQEKKEFLRAIAGRLRDLGEPASAAVYASELAELEPDARNLMVAGALARVAASRFANDADSIRFRRFSDHAISLLEKADKEKPGDENILIELGLAMAESGKAGLNMQGIQKLVKVLEINPANTEAAYQLGIFSMQTGQFEKAAGRFETVVKADPNNLEAQLLLAGAYKETGKKEDAIRILSGLSDQKENPEIGAMASQLLNELKK